MIPNRIRGSRRSKSAKLPKNLKRLFIEGKCRECAVVVTRMNFAKILGKFTKVKIQYESSTPKTNQNSQMSSPKTISRLKSNENGMVQIRRNAYIQHPAKEVTATQKRKVESPRSTPNILKENNRLKKSVFKDKNPNNNNNCSNLIKKNNINLKQYGIVFQDPLIHMHNNINDVSSKISLSDLISQINDSILPSEDWCIDFFPKKGEPKDDKVYDRIAAELEDLMYNEKPVKSEKQGIIETKVDDFPSIMDILNDNTRDIKTNDHNSCLEYKPNLESSDVEAMLLGKSDPISDPVPPTPMEVDNSDVSNLIDDVNQLTANQDDRTLITTDKLPVVDIKSEEIENPRSPSILDEALKMGIEEHLPSTPVKSTEKSDLIKDDVNSVKNADTKVEDIGTKVIEAVTKTTNESKETIEKTNVSKEIIEMTNESKEIIKTTDQSKETIEATNVSDETIEATNVSKKIDASFESKGTIEACKKPKQISKTVHESQETIDTSDESKDSKLKQICSFASIEGITHLVFKKSKDGNCFKTVTCPKNLKYDIEINGKSVEFIGAPKYISSLEDLKVLLQIVNESELDSLYVLH